MESKNAQLHMWIDGTLEGNCGDYQNRPDMNDVHLQDAPLDKHDTNDENNALASSNTQSSPSIWDSDVDFFDSQSSSPTLLGDTWALPPPQMTSSPDYTLLYSPSPESHSPTYLYEHVPDLWEVPSYPTGHSGTSSPFGSRTPNLPQDFPSFSKHPPPRDSLDLHSTARDHPLYHNVIPQADGLYHCPFEDDPKAKCTHKPEKLKCNYDKFVDSHLKPYRCKLSSCKDLSFSSTACLLRHERLAHAMHGHGEKPYLCTYEGCERGVMGNGFPRRWNLRDHMKRVHNDAGPPKRNVSASPSLESNKGKKRKTSDYSLFVEKSPGRTGTPLDPSLIERYRENHQLLAETVAKLSKLRDPKNEDTMDLLRAANDCIKLMVQTSQRINSAPDSL